jgi:hypothetical protein
MKVIQVSHIPESDANHSGLLALCDDGSIYTMIFRRGLNESKSKWSRLASPATQDKSIAESQITTGQECNPFECPSTCSHKFGICDNELPPCAFRIGEVERNKLRSLKTEIIYLIKKYESSLGIEFEEELVGPLIENIRKLVAV